MTLYGCVICGYSIDKGDSRPVVIRGLCTDCYDKDPTLLKTVPEIHNPESRAASMRRYG